MQVTVVGSMAGLCDTPPTANLAALLPTPVRAGTMPRDSPDSTTRTVATSRALCLAPPTLRLRIEAVMPLPRPPFRIGITVAMFAVSVSSLAAPVLVTAQPAPVCAAAVSIRDSAGLPLREGVVLAQDAAHRTDSLGNVRFATASSTPLVARIRHIGFAPGRVMIFPT